MASDAMTKSFSLTFAEDLANEFNNDQTDQYFLYFGKIDSWTNSPYSTASTATPATNVDSVEKANFAMRDGVAAKRISSRNIYHMIPRNNWTVGTVYDEYSHTAEMLSTTTVKTFFVYTSTGNIYKCLDNSGGGESSYEPDHTITSQVSYSDGYVWLFMGRVLEDAKDFITESYIPVQFALDNSDNYINQWNAQQAAVNGAITKINVTVPGAGVTAAAWTKSSYSATSSEETDNEIGANAGVGSTTIVIDSTESNVDDYYNSYAIYISSGPGVGQRRPITDYDASSRTVTFAEPLITAISQSVGGVPGSRYKIIPNLVVNGDGVSAEAIPTLNSAYEITGVSVVNNGYDYTIGEIDAYPKSVSGGNIGSNNIVGPTFDVVIPPKGGHANNILDELGANKIMIRTVIKGSDTNFTTAQDFRQITLVKNPLLLGGTNDGKIAGSEIVRRKQLKVVKPWFMNNSFNDSSFTTGNSVMGENTRATGKIEAWISDADGSVGTLELSNLQGNFDIEDPASTLTRIVFPSTSTGNTGDFTAGNVVKQTNSGLVAQGKVISWTAPDGGPYELVVQVTSNSFSTSTIALNNSVIEYNPLGTATTGVDWLQTSVVERKMGELIKHFSSPDGSTFEFYTFPTTNGYQNIARANKLTDVQDEDTLERSYRLSTQMIIEDSGSGLGDGSYTKDDTFYQVNYEATGITGSIVTGKVVDWSATNGNTGVVTLNDVRGTFNTGGFSGSANHSITSISLPEIKVGSGEVLYIENIRPVTRGIEQDEEIKIMIGF